MRVLRVLRALRVLRVFRVFRVLGFRVLRVGVSFMARKKGAKSPAFLGSSRETPSKGTRLHPASGSLK